MQYNLNRQKPSKLNMSPENDEEPPVTNLPGNKMFALSPRKKCRSYTWTEEDLEDRVAGDPRIHPQKRLLTRLVWHKTLTPIPESSKERQEFPFRNTNLFSELFFTWVNPVLRVGYLRTLQPEDLFRIPSGSRYDVEVRTRTFVDAFMRRKEAAECRYLKSNGIADTPDARSQLHDDKHFEYPKHLVLGALYDTFKVDYVVAICIKLIADIAQAMNSLLVRGLINYVDKKALGLNPGGKGYGYAVGISCIVMFTGLLFARYFHDAMFCGAEMKGVLTKALLDKSFVVDRSERVRFPPSELSSFLGNDLSKIDLAASFFAFVTNLPVGLALTIILLAVNVGGAALTGIAWFIIVTIAVTFCVRILMRLRVGANVSTDLRIRYVKEILGSIKIIKYYAWEIPYSKMLAKFRTSEMGQILRIQFIRNNLTAVSVTLPNVSAMIGFLVMYAVHGSMKSAAQVFSSLTLFNILTSHVAMFPTALTTAGDALVAFQRVQKFLLAEDEAPDPEYHCVGRDSARDAISIDHGSFTWEIAADSDAESHSSASLNEKSEKVPLSTKTGSESETDGSETETDSSFKGLVDLNLHIKHGEFVVVTGSIGSGKSSLLSAIKGVMPRTTGSITISGNVTLCGSPWIQNATVRDNIFFGNPHNEQKYRTVVDACALRSDFDILPAGDLTEIGERGVNLSGGQKARINLARAVYNVDGFEDRNIILFDDVLSAVDAKVGRHIMNRCILGLLGGKTRVLATHQLALIGAADRIVFMNGDGSLDVGTGDELLKRNSQFKELMQFQMEGREREEVEDGRDDTDKAEDDDENVDSDLDSDAESHSPPSPLPEDLKIIHRQTTKKEYEEERGRLIRKETRKENSIPLSMVIAYIREGCDKYGIRFMVPNLVLSVTFTTFTMLFQNVWLAFWTSHRFPKTNSFYIGIYILFTFLFVICAAWQFCTIVFVCNNASRNLNIKAMNRVMHAPMSFFDTTPMGRILNRFTKDTDTLDNEIAEQARLFCFGLGNMIGILLMCCVYLPYFTIAVPFIFIWTVVVFSYYQASAREIKRLEGIERSRVFANFDEVLQGVETIKFYNAVPRFESSFTHLINCMNEPYLLSNSVQRWLAVRLHICSALVNLIVSILSVTRAFPISASSSGLLVSYLVSFSAQLISTSRSGGQLEQYLSCVERIAEYAFELPQEARYNSTEEQKPASDWPQRGEIQFSHVFLRYRPELPHVLSDFSLHVNPGEKIGICGRTGAGKSTIMTALYRLSEPESGSIAIDGVNTLDLGLYDLRSHLSIIPQEPVLFRGTIRQNLDPFNLHTDDVLYQALETAGCVSAAQIASGTVTASKFSMDGFVQDNGENFSLGERQVLALCRALVKDTRILVLDEATSSVDYETDARIQDTITQQFSQCTILCIAHRLKTIINYDRILVMDRGRLNQFDTPWRLFNTDGIFRSMCDKSGITEEDFVKKEQ